jgi:hypothetical protein
MLAILRVTFVATLYLVLTSVSHAQVSAQLAQKAPDAAAIAAAAEQQGHVRIIVEFTGPVPANQLRPDPAFLAPVKAQIASVQDAIIGSVFGSATSPRPGQGFPRGLLRFDITPMFAVNVDKAELDALAADPRVTVIHLDRLEAPTLIQSVPLVGMPAAYTARATGLGQAVAVVDTGVQSNHEFLSGKVVMEACFSNAAGGGTGVTLCPNGMTSESGAGSADPTTAQCINNTTNLCIHGTHVAGIAAGFNTNGGGGKPTNGVAQGAKIVAVQVFTRFNDMASCNNNPPCVLAYNSDTVSALNWLFQNALTPAAGVALASANMSLGGGQFFSACDSDARKPSIDNLRGAGVATAIASGNNGYVNAVSAPGCISTAVTVGSSDKSDVISSFSNMATMVKLMAPGGFGGGTCQLGANNPDILSSLAATSSAVTNLYVCLAGTSMATPHVAGAFAAIRTACPAATVDQILTALENTGISIVDTRAGGTVTKPRIRVDLAVQQLACGSRVATHDFNGDGKSDILWRDNTGTTAIWLMNAAQALQTGSIGTIPTNWSIAAQRDFDGDGKYDLLWHDTSAGTVAIWLMNGLQVSQAAALATVPTTWSIVGTGDFDGDGKGDILWRDNSGNVAIWLLNGTTVKSSGFVGNVPSQWTVVGTGDFNGDGKYDILWRDNTGTTVIWLMNGATVTQSASLGIVPSNWTVAGTGDFNGDGRWDILWHDSSGNVAIWFIAQGGLSVQTAAGLGNVSTNWNVVLTGDFNGDGTSDILWRNFNGDTSLWFMNGTVVQFAAAVGNINTSWQVVGIFSE